jgi:hypothetical protein
MRMPMTTPTTPEITTGLSQPTSLQDSVIGHFLASIAEIGVLDAAVAAAIRQAFSGGNQPSRARLLAVVTDALSERENAT